MGDIAIVRSKLLILAAISIVSVDAVYAGVCDDFKGEAYGLCLAAESIPCTVETQNEKACEELAKEFTGLTNSIPPWLNTIEEICPCRLEMDQVFSEIEGQSLAVEGKCFVGQLTENVPVPNSMGIQIIGQVNNRSETMLLGAYTYHDSDPKGGQCELDATIEPLGHIYTALIITEAEQKVCAEVIRQIAVFMEIDCLEP